MRPQLTNKEISAGLIPGLDRMSITDQIFPKKNVGLSDIIEIVSYVTGIKKTDIADRLRLAPIVEARHIFNFAARESTDYSLHDIGSFINKDHATVVHSCTVMMRLKDNPSEIMLRNKIDRVFNMIDKKKRGI